MVLGRAAAKREMVRIKLAISVKIFFIVCFFKLELRPFDIYRKKYLRGQDYLKYRLKFFQGSALMFSLFLLSLFCLSIFQMTCHEMNWCDKELLNQLPGSSYRLQVNLF